LKSSSICLAVSKYAAVNPTILVLKLIEVMQLTLKIYSVNPTILVLKYYKKQ